jgi:membrane protease YdiL (CAAX protease family)
LTGVDLLPTGSAIAVTAAAVVAIAACWELVRRGRSRVWSVMPGMVGLLAVVAILTGKVRSATDMGVPAAAGIGLAAGALLYGATAAFMAVAGRWPPLRRQARTVYELRGGLSIPTAIVLAALVVAPSEEIVWRGMVQTLFGGWLGSGGGALLAWAVYVAVNAVARSLPILLGAVVGGAAWAGLAWWTGGVAAPIACHVVWTGLMVAWPPVRSGSR